MFLVPITSNSRVGMDEEDVVTYTVVAALFAILLK